MMGARLPCGFETDDAECYAVYKALRQVCEQAEAEGRDPVRSDTLLRTVKSIQRGVFPTRRAAATRAAPSTPRLVSAARVGPVVYGLLLTFRGDGYG